MLYEARRLRNTENALRAILYLFGDVVIAAPHTNLFICLLMFFFSANIEITRVRKSNESENAVMRAALKKEQTKSASLEMTLQQKVYFLWQQFQAFCVGSARGIVHTSPEKFKNTTITVH